MAQPVLGVRIRVDASTGLRLPGNFPTPLNPAGGQDVSALLEEGFGGLEFAAGTHRITLTLPFPQIIERVALLNQGAEGTYTVFLSNSDPTLLGPAQAPRLQTLLQGPHQLNTALFAAQAATFLQLEFHLTKPGRLARFEVFGRTSDLDYGLVTPPDPPPAAAVTKPLNILALSAGARIERISSGGAGADPNVLISDALGIVYPFQQLDRSPEFDVTLHAPRRADRATLYFSAPPCRVELIRLQPPRAPDAPGGEVTIARARGSVETVNLDGSSQEAAKVGGVLKAGQVLQLGWDSMAEVDIDGQSLLRLGPNSGLAVRAGGPGLTLSLLRGAALWQVYKPGSGPLQLATPSAMAVLPSSAPSIVSAQVDLSGESTLETLASGLDGIQVRSLATGECASLRAGQKADIGPGLLAPVQIGSFSPFEEWNQASWGAVLGGLHEGAEKLFSGVGAGFMAGLVSGDVLASTTTAGGLTEVTLPFKEQTLEAVAFRITPLGERNGTEPVVVIKAGLFGAYELDECAVTYQGRPLITSVLSAPAALPPASHPGLASPSAVHAPAAATLPPLPQKEIPVAPAVAVPVMPASPPVAPAVGIAVPDNAVPVKR